MKEFHEDEQMFTEQETDRLNKRANALKNRLEKIYLDKVDGKITEEFWEEKHNEWTLEHAAIRQKLEAYEQASVNYMIEASKLVELLENLYSRYIQLNADEKGEVVKIILSNFFIDGLKVRYEYKKPFDIFAKGLSCSLDWAILDLNQGPYAYQAYALTTSANSPQPLSDEYIIT